jgi:hypothetical protein
MGFGDKFKDLAKQAQDAVAEHKEQIHDAVDAVGVAADRRTHGKYTAKIAKMGEKAGDAVEKLGARDGQPDAGQPRADGPSPTQTGPGSAPATGSPDANDGAPS